MCSASGPSRGLGRLQGPLVPCGKRSSIPSQPPVSGLFFPVFGLGTVNIKRTVYGRRDLRDSGQLNKDETRPRAYLS